VQTPVEFGHKVFLAESAQGLITQYEILQGNPCDEVHVSPSLQHHREIFGHAPDLYSTDRGFYSEDNVKACRQDGTYPPTRGQKTAKRAAFEKTPAFKQGQ